MAYKILFVDDEEKILSSLRRLFMEDCYSVFTASNGVEALRLLEKESIDIVVSDQRMPMMSGVEFLQHSKAVCPDCIRILLTGYSDMNAAIDCINKGEIYRYITKPWNNDELKAIVENALELKKLRKENESLLKLTKKQNIELKDLNSNLEEKVKKQTKDICNLLEESMELYKKLDKSFIDSIRMFSNLIRLRNKAISIHQKNTAKLTKEIAQKMILTEREIKDIEIAALLHDIGKIGIKDDILNKAFDDMTAPEKVVFMKHPILGQAVLESIKNMQNVGVIIEHHHERWDGKGYPDNLSEKEIPIGSRVIAIASDYDAIMNGTLIPSKLKSKDARQFILDNSNLRYDPGITTLAIPIISKYEKEIRKKPEIMVYSHTLKEGMVLSKDLYTLNGFLLLNENVKITRKHIDNIINFETAEGKKYDIYILPRKEAKSDSSESDNGENPPISPF